VTSSTLAFPAAPESTVEKRSAGGVTEFMLVGGATLVLFPVAWLVRATVGLDSGDFAFGFLTFYGAYIINDPHFTVTYFLFYKGALRRAFGAEYHLPYRIRYLVAGALVPAGLVGWAAFALRSHSAAVLGWMIQLMFLLVGWHYVKQGFGVLTVLCARRGTKLSALERKVILAHALIGWAYAWASPAIQAGEFEEKGVVYRAIARPRWLELGAGAALAMSAIALVAVLAMKWRRERRALPMAPLAGFLITIWLWTIYSSVDPLIRYVIPALHSIQYGYFVISMKKSEARAEEGPPSFGRPAAVRLGALALSALALGWLLFHGAPAVLDGLLVPHPRRGATFNGLGPTPYFAAFYAIVNIHHYFMDAVVWRRDNPETRYLLDARPQADA
jgi:hypothetical protein